MLVKTAGSQQEAGIECTNRAQGKYSTSSVRENVANVTQQTVLGLFIDVYKAEDKIVTSGATSLSDLDLRGTYIYRAIDSVATDSMPSLFCECSMSVQQSIVHTGILF